MSKNSHGNYKKSNLCHPQMAKEFLRRHFSRSGRIYASYDPDWDLEAHLKGFAKMKSLARQISEVK